MWSFTLLFVIQLSTLLFLLLMNRNWAWTFESLNIWILKKEWTNLFNQKVILPYVMLFIPCMFLYQYIIQHTQSVIRIYQLYIFWPQGAILRVSLQQRTVSELGNLRYILKSNPHLFTVSEGWKIRCGLESHAD